LNYCALARYLFGRNEDDIIIFASRDIIIADVRVDAIVDTQKKTNIFKILLRHPDYVHSRRVCVSIRTPGGASSHCVAKAYLLDTFLLFIFVSKPGKKKISRRGVVNDFNHAPPPPLSKCFFSFFLVVGRLGGVHNVHFHRNDEVRLQMQLCAHLVGARVETTTTINESETEKKSFRTLSKGCPFSVR
jgi:hypothetical protein